MTSRRWLYTGAAFTSVTAATAVLGLWGFAVAAVLGACLCAQQYRDAKRAGR